jgi:Asp-tRNA(Asn)/Glu-tRNA(Gln) amidotransferase A subunit family amidase
MTDRIDAFATATLLGALGAGKVSALELLELHRRRIEWYNPSLNAIVEPDFERAHFLGDAILGTSR